MLSSLTCPVYYCLVYRALLLSFSLSSKRDDDDDDDNDDDDDDFFWKKRTATLLNLLVKRSRSTFCLLLYTTIHDATVNVNFYMLFYAMSTLRYDHLFYTNIRHDTIAGLYSIYIRIVDKPSYGI